MNRLPLVLLLISLGAQSATTLYKSVDEHGNITYSDAPPTGAKDVQQIEVQESDTNVLPSAGVGDQIQQQQQTDRQAEASKNAAMRAWQQRYQQAQAELEQAEQTLLSAQQIQEGDTVGSAFGGARPNADWIERLHQAEADVERRRRELDSIKRQRP